MILKLHRSTIHLPICIVLVYIFQLKMYYQNNLRRITVLSKIKYNYITTDPEM